jgi:hypothetical protein
MNNGQRAEGVKEAKLVLAVSLAMAIVGAVLLIQGLMGQDFGIWMMIGRCH